MVTRINMGANFNGYTNRTGILKNAYAHLNLVKTKCRNPTLQIHCKFTMGEILTTKLQLYYAKFILDFLVNGDILSYN